MVNKVILVGNLGKDPELKTTKGGKSVVSFSLATSFGSGDKEQTEWHNIEAWDKLADNIAQYMKKGSKMYLEGRIRTDKVEGDQGVRYFTKVVAHEAKFLDSKPRGGIDSSDLPF